MLNWDSHAVREKVKRILLASHFHNVSCDVNSDTELISFPEIFVLLQKKSLQELIDCVFPDIKHHYQNPQWLAERAIKCPKNIEVYDVNILI
jgi:PIF1-like helicase